MKVGFLRFDDKPGIKAKGIAFISKYYDIEFFYFTPESVDLEREIIMGKFLINGEWVEKETGFPDIIDNAPSRPQDRDLYSKLKKKSPMITYRIGDKEKVLSLLQKDSKYSKYLIDSKILTSLDDFNEFVEKYEYIILKPKGGNMGKNIFKCFRSKNGFCIQTDKVDKNINSEIELNEFLSTFYDKYQIQEYINSTTFEGHPFDVRLHVQRGKGGSWKIVKIYPRIGLSQKVTSNISQGGGISNLNSFLRNQYIENHNEIWSELRSLSLSLPRDFQKNYTYTLDALGIDVGIDRNGNLKIFEINTYPGSNFLDLESAIVRVDYYKHLLEKRG